MMLRSAHSVLWLALALTLVSGCKKKQKQVTPAAQVPTITAPITAPPLEETKPAPSPEKPPPVVVEKPKVKPKPKVAAKKPVVKPPATEPSKPAPDTTTVAKATPPRIVAQTPNASPVEVPTNVVPNMTHTEEAHHRQTTDQLMLSTEANLKSLKRVLNADERSLLQQVQLFMAQSREASESQDVVRAHNLALKAHLLSDELVR